MKFTKEDAFKQIEGFLTDNGKKDLLLSKRSVNAALDTLMPLLADDETDLSVFIEKVKPTFQTMYGNLKYDTSQFAKKWIEDHPEPAKEPEQAPKAEGEQNPMLARIEKLEAELAKRDRENAVVAKRNEIVKTLVEKGVNDPEWVSDLFKEVVVGEDTDTAEAAERYLRLYNRSHAHTPANVTPGATAVGESRNQFDDVVQLRKSRAEAEKGQITTN